MMIIVASAVAIISLLAGCIGLIFWMYRDDRAQTKRIERAIELQNQDNPPPERQED